MHYLKMSTISFYLLLKASRFSNTYYNNHYLRHLQSHNFFSTREKKKQPYIKIPTQHYTARRSLQQKIAIFTGNLQRCFQTLFEWRRFYKVYGYRRRAYSKGLLFEWKRQFEGLRWSRQLYKRYFDMGV